MTLLGSGATLEIVVFLLFEKDRLYEKSSDFV